MGKRKVPSAPLGIHLKHNAETELYETVENGITYQLTFSQMNDMKSFLSGRGYKPTIIAWYNQLPPYEKKKIKVIGLPKQPDDFTPDAEWED